MERIDQIAVVKDLLHNKRCISLTDFVNNLHSLLYKNLQTSSLILSDLVDSDFLEEVRWLSCQRNIALYFGKSLRHLKCVLPDDSGLRDHEITILYKGPKKLCVSDAVLPRSALQDREYTCITEIMDNFQQHIENLSGYFYELERIDRFCTVVEPAKPSFRDNFRRILLDDRTWLHIEVTPKGFAANVHLLGHSEHWHDKLQAGLLNWDHDNDIVENITTVFDIMNFPTQQRSLSSCKETADVVEEAVCSICLCSELPDVPAVPQPLCQNPQCAVYFHRTCLFQWLVACSGGRPPAFGVASGACPSCLQPTTCSEKDS